MSLVFWDTNLFIYILEENQDFRARVGEIRLRMLQRGDRLCTSCMTVGEALTAPYLRHDEAIAAQYKAVFFSANILVLPFTLAAADHYAWIRAHKPSVGRADAVQLACAAEAKVDLFITNDSRLRGEAIPGIQFIAGLDNCPL
jgi:predicted nucleic acid-binding protein